MTEPLTYLINISFTEDIFPRELKFARIFAILKAGRITNYLDDGDVVISVFLNIKKTFDTVDPSHFTYGIRGNIHKWFQSYLTDRSQYVVYNNQ